MWFDPHARLAELETHHIATPAAPAAEPPLVSKVSQLPKPPAPAEPANPTPDVASVASVATAKALDARPVALTPEAFPHGTACNLGIFPKTWTGRVVSLADWRLITEWERRGPAGRYWDGKTRQWEQH